jgi:hypothetical protein
MSIINNLRDLLGYALDAWDVLVVRHRIYRYCQFVASVFSEQDTLVHRILQPLFEEDK